MPNCMGGSVLEFYYIRIYSGKIKCIIPYPTSHGPSLIQWEQKKGTINRDIESNCFFICVKIILKHQAFSGLFPTNAFAAFTQSKSGKSRSLLISIIKMHRS